MNSYIVQPEKRHEMQFGQVSKVLDKNNSIIFITNRSTKLPFSKNKKEELCLNSFGLTFYVLKNILRILQNTT